jgi:hypothetical protein
MQPIFAHVPRTEQEVVCLFSLLLDDIEELPKPVLIETVQTAFPDCVVRAGGEQVRIEFELYGSNFNHQCDGCEMLVCWRDDRNDWPDSFTVVELAEIVLKKRQYLFASLEESYPSPWNPDTFFAAAERGRTDAASVALARRTIELAKEYGFGPTWLAGPKPVFAVGRPQFFKISASGRIGFPFSRLDAGDFFVSLADRLNSVVPGLGLSAADANTKRRGGQLSGLFTTDHQLREFFDVWKWFKARDSGPF